MPSESNPKNDEPTNCDVAAEDENGNSESDANEVDRNQRRQNRRNLRLVFAGLLVIAIAVTGWQWYQGEYVVGNQPIGWQKVDWPTVKREMRGGRKMAIFVGKENGDKSNDEFLERFETTEIRKSLFFARRLPLKLVLPDDQETRAEVFSTLNIEQTPCCVINHQRKPKTILSGRMTTSEIADRIGN